MKVNKSGMSGVRPHGTYARIEKVRGPPSPAGKVHYKGLYEKTLPREEGVGFARLCEHSSTTSILMGGKTAGTEQRPA